MASNARIERLTREALGPPRDRDHEGALVPEGVVVIAYLFVAASALADAIAAGPGLA